MNATINDIMRRRSVRGYADIPVPQDALDAVLAAGHAAPSGMNLQDWRFVVATDKDFLGRLARAGRAKYEEWLAKAPESFRDMRKAIDAASPDPVYYGAPAVVFVIGKGMTAPLDCPMVCQNMMLAARSLGLGSCWVYFGQLALGEPDIRAALELAEGENVYGPILLGYPADGAFPEAPEKKPIEVKRI